jgi:hypothetical protein
MYDGDEMSVQLDETLIYRTKRRAREDGLTPDERIAINLLWRKKVRVPVLAKVFKVSKNTIYYKALTGTADSCPNSNRSNSAKETNEVIERLGPDAAWSQFVTDKMVKAVNDENRREADRRKKRGGS